MARSYVIRPVVPGDAAALAAVMRPEDAFECAAVAGYTPLQALEESLRQSRASFALDLGGEVAALFGVCDGPRQTLLGPTAYDVVWLLTGRAVDAHRVAFWRASGRALRALLRVHPVLANMVDARYLAALRWAQRLGAEVLDAVPWGARGLPFHPVIWRA